MRAGISFIVSPADRVRLTALIGDRRAPQQHVWRTGDEQWSWLTLRIDEAPWNQPTRNNESALTRVQSPGLQSELLDEGWPP